MILTRADRAAALRAPGRPHPRLPGHPRRAERVHLRPARARGEPGGGVRLPRRSARTSRSSAAPALAPADDPDAPLLRRLLARRCSGRSSASASARRARPPTGSPAGGSSSAAALPVNTQRRPPLRGALERLGADARDRPPAARRGRPAADPGRRARPVGDDARRFDRLRTRPRVSGARDPRHSPAPATRPRCCRRATARTRRTATRSREGRLVLQACEGCGRLRYPIAPVCPYCGAARRLARCGGDGTVHSWVRHRRGYLPSSSR